MSELRCPVARFAQGINKVAGFLLSRKDMTKGGTMSLSRRDLMKLGVVGGAALALPLERTVSARSSAQGRLASSRLPRPFTLQFRTPPVLQPYRTNATTDFYKVYMKPLQAEVVPGL